MKVEREPLDALPMARLVVTDPEGTGHVTGEVTAYYCDGCDQLDESLDQVWHAPDCDLAGQHGRQHYDRPDPAVRFRETPEFDPDHEIVVIKAAETEGHGGLCEGEVLGFRCECGNADETLFEVRHDESCPLAGRHSHVAQVDRAGRQAYATDGGA